MAKTRSSRSSAGPAAIRTAASSKPTRVVQAPERYADIRYGAYGRLSTASASRPTGVKKTKKSQSGKQRKKAVKKTATHMTKVNNTTKQAVKGITNRKRKRTDAEDGPSKRARRHDAEGSTDEQTAQEMIRDVEEETQEQGEPAQDQGTYQTVATGAAPSSHKRKTSAEDDEATPQPQSKRRRIFQEDDAEGEDVQQDDTQVEDEQEDNLQVTPGGYAVQPTIRAETHRKAPQSSPQAGARRPKGKGRATADAHSGDDEVPDYSIFELRLKPQYHDQSEEEAAIAKAIAAHWKVPTGNGMDEAVELRIGKLARMVDDTFNRTTDLERWDEIAEQLGVEKVVRPRSDYRNDPTRARGDHVRKIWQKYIASYEEQDQRRELNNDMRIRYGGRNEFKVSMNGMGYMDVCPYRLRHVVNDLGGWQAVTERTENGVGRYSWAWVARDLEIGDARSVAEWIETGDNVQTTYKISIAPIEAEV